MWFICQTFKLLVDAITSYFVQGNNPLQETWVMGVTWVLNGKQCLIPRKQSFTRNIKRPSCEAGQNVVMQHTITQDLAPRVAKSWATAFLDITQSTPCICFSFMYW